MSPISPLFVSPDRKQFVIAMADKNTTIHICSSTKLRNALNEAFIENGIENESAMHYKEVAAIFINATKEVTGQVLEAIKFSDGNGKYLTVSQKSFEHNFDTTLEIVVDCEDESLQVDLSDQKKISHTADESNNWQIKQRAKIRARLQKLADKYDN